MRMNIFESVLQVIFLISLVAALLIQNLPLAIVAVAAACITLGMRIERFATTFGKQKENATDKG